ncbi:MAG: U32 family peptidase [Roseburia sp.]|nr:U32 family peptidase [Roseburia sp.]
MSSKNMQENSDFGKKSKQRMKIVAGLGSIEEYIPYVEAGADELFCGYVPYWWSQKYGTLSPLNRREVLAYHVQIGAFEDLKILSNLVKIYGVPVTIALNALYYVKEQYEEIASIVASCMEIGFDSFIIADPALVFFLREKGIHCNIHLSGEMSEVNSLFLEQMAKYDISRVIFHRKNSFLDMESCVRKTKEKIPEYEAFVLNEMCHFTGAYCNSLHCDELGHLCKVPYQLGCYEESAFQSNVLYQSKENLHTVYKTQEEKSDCMLDSSVTASVEYEPKMKVYKSKTDVCVPGANEEAEIDGYLSRANEEAEIDGYLIGETGCGLCALASLQTAGVTHLKVVGRGNYIDYEKEDIRQLKRALTILEEVEALRQKDSGEVQLHAEFQRRIRTRLFYGECSHNCYYRNHV